MKKDIKHIFWMLLCLFTIVACSDENHEMLITGPEIPELDHEPSIEELVEGINNYPTKFKGDKQGKIWYKAAAGDDLYGYEGDVYVHIGINDWMYVPTEWGEMKINTRQRKWRIIFGALHLPRQYANGLARKMQQTFKMSASSSAMMKR